MTSFYDSEVLSVQTPCDGVREIFLRPPHSAHSYAVGSHIQVICEHEGREIVRSYSLVGRFHEQDSFRIAVRLAPDSRGGSRYMWKLSVGDRIRISRPKNEFSLSDRNAPRLLVAGGIGITPLIGMAYTLLERGQEFTLAYLGRSRLTMPFLERLQMDLGSKLNVLATDEIGMVPMQSLIQGLAADGEVYVCGPLGMLTDVKSAWEASGRKSQDLRFENFANSGTIPSETFFVSVPRLGLDVEVPPDLSLLEVLEREGADPLFNCRKGECGLCAVQLLSYNGTIDHRDVFFSAHQKSENKALCACVSRMGGGRMVIELP